jgi:hypothetical protein
VFRRELAAAFLRETGRSELALAPLDVWLCVALHAAAPHRKAAVALVRRKAVGGCVCVHAPSGPASLTAACAGS